MAPKVESFGGVRDRSASLALGRDDGGNICGPTRRWKPLVGHWLGQDVRAPTNSFHLAPRAKQTQGWWKDLGTQTGIDLVQRTTKDFHHGLAESQRSLADGGINWWRSWRRPARTNSFHLCVQPCHGLAQGMVEGFGVAHADLHLHQILPPWVAFGSNAGERLSWWKRLVRWQPL